MRFAHTPIILAAAVAVGCAEGAVAPNTSDSPTLQAGVGSVAHRVTVGGPDVCTGLGLPTGCDANFSLVALQFSDGSVSGQWHDVTPPSRSVHVTVNCLVVAGNEAWVSGVGPEHDFGNEWVARVRDNGRSANDPADQISLTRPVGIFSGVLGEVVEDCNGMQAFPLFDAPQGQTVVVQ